MTPTEGCPGCHQARQLITGGGWTECRVCGAVWTYKSSDVGKTEPMTERRARLDEIRIKTETTFGEVPAKCQKINPLRIQRGTGGRQCKPK